MPVHWWCWLCALPTQTSMLCVDFVSPSVLAVTSLSDISRAFFYPSCRFFSYMQTVKPRQRFIPDITEMQNYSNKKSQFSNRLWTTLVNHHMLCTEQRKSTYLLVGPSQKLQAWSQPQAAWIQSGKAGQWYLQGVNMEGKDKNMNSAAAPLMSLLLNITLS